VDGSDSEWVEIADLPKGPETDDGMVIDSNALRTVLDRASRVAPYPATVLIDGESGTGKELIARRLHALGTRPDGPYVVFNCSNLMDTLAESQLFGHSRGSFTGAHRDALGYFRTAEGGTLFLDEIGELPLSLQPKLLRTLDEREIKPVGSTNGHRIDVRVITATNRDIGAMVQRGEFRGDLYYRLGSVRLTMPPLRERAGAIEVLSANFIRAAMRTLGVSISAISRSALEALNAYEWPGNVRELLHAIEHAVTSSDGGLIDLDALPDYVRCGAERGIADHSRFEHSEHVARFVSAADDGMLRHAIDDAVRRALRASGGQRTETARALGISRSTLYRWMSQMRAAESHAP
jgi:transcriptional regulator with PAS, ATPase and Fis domain